MPGQYFNLKGVLILKNRFDVIISGYYGFGNMGDEAVLSVLTQKLCETEPSLRIAVIAGHIKKAEKCGNITYIPRHDIPGIVRAMKGAVLVSGGGSLLQNVTSCRSLLYYTSVLFAGKLLCRKVISYANGIGPVKSGGKALMKIALSLSDVMTVRDTDSYETAVTMGVSPDKIYVSADPVFLIDSASEEKARQILHRLGIGQRKFFAVSLRNFAAGNEATVCETVKFCRAQKRGGLIPLFVPMQESFDGEICRRAAKMCSGYVLCTTDAKILLSVLKKAEFSVGMRLHFLLLSAMAGIPCVALSYDRKIDSEMPYVGENHILPCSGVTAQSIQCTLKKAQKDTSAEILRERCLDMKVRAMHDIGMIAAYLCTGDESDSRKNSILKIGIKSAGND